jgi:mRNA interferase MazF
VVIGVTSNEATLGAVSVYQWREAGLLHPSSIKPIIATLSHPEVIKKIGKLTVPDGNALKRMLLKVLNLS